MFMALAVDPDVRHQAEEWIFEFYYTLLKCELSQDGIEMPFTVRDVSTRLKTSNHNEVSNPAAFVRARLINNN